MITDPNGMWKDEGDGKWTAEKGDSWWSLHKQSGMTWKETMAYAKKYNAGKGRDNWKTVRVGDKVTVSGNDNKNGSTESSTPSVDQSQYSNENIGIIEPIQVQSRSSAPGSGWDPLVIAINEFTDKGDIFPLLEMLTSGGPGAVACPAEFFTVGATAKTSMSLWPAASGGRTVINGIEYTVHALERMQPVGTIIKGTASFSRGIPPSVVENAIKYGKVTPENTPAEVVRTFKNVRVITNPTGTRVISVIKIGR
jgi:hypothetical protein